LCTHLHLAPRLKNEWSSTFTPPLGFHGMFHGEFYHYSIQRFVYPFIEV